MGNRNAQNIIVFGTRPEFIKLLPLIKLIRKRGLDSKFIIVYTGQQSAIVEELFDIYQIIPHYTIPFMDHSNSILKCFNYILGKLDVIIKLILDTGGIQRIIGQGDTTTCLCAAFTAFLNKIPFAHIEAGLRTYDSKNPFPEEYFRRIITQSTEIHFAPTQNAFNNLVNENVDRKNIIVTGNTIIDAIKLAQTNIVNPKKYFYLKNDDKNVLITCHRHENQKEVIDRLIIEIMDLASKNPNINFIWIRHPNPLIIDKLKRITSKVGVKNINIIPPVSYQDMIQILPKINLFVTDSGGIQEEASYFGVPVIVIREATERIESIEKGIAYLQNSNLINFHILFEKYINKSITRFPDLYGDGTASEKILNYFIESSKMIPMLK